MATEHDMRAVAAIAESPIFRECLARIDAAEAARAFCRHGLSHLLDVARIAWIFNLERGHGLRKDVVYAAALLHDIGRAEQYATGEDHDEAGVRIAARILDGLPNELRFDARERQAILDAVGGHRGEGDASECRDARAVKDAASTMDGTDRDVLVALIREADNRSRPCYACPARDACYWSDERKNLSLDI